jgi:hypothetical protein
MFKRLVERRRRRKEWRRFYRELRSAAAAGRPLDGSAADGLPLVTVAFDEHGNQFTVLGDEPVQSGQVVSVAARSLGSAREQADG